MAAYRNAVVYVIADDAAELDRLEQLFSSVHLRIEAYRNAEAFLSRLRAVGPGCVVADTEALAMDVTVLLELLGERHLPAILLSGTGDVPLAVAAMKAGAVDFMERPFNGQALLDAVNEALMSASGAACRHAASREMRERFQSLTERERQVLMPMIRGAPNRQIAAELGVREKTVEVYRGRVLRKVGAANLAELIRMALRAWPDSGPANGADHTPSSGRRLRSGP